MRQIRRIPLIELLGSLMPITGMGKAMLAGIIVWFIDWVFGEGQTIFGSAVLKKLVDFASILAFIPLIYFLIRGARGVTQHLLWRLRRRLIVTYFLIGVLPILLLISLVTLIGFVVILQSSANLVSRQLDGYLGKSRAAAQSLSRDIGNWEIGQLTEDQLRRRLQERANALAPIFPELTLSIRRVDEDNPIMFVKAESTEGGEALSIKWNDDRRLPGWMSGREEFHGLVVEEKSSADRHIRARHIIKVAKPSPLVFQLTYPIGETLCRQLRETTDIQLTPGKAVRPLLLTAIGPQMDQDEASQLKTESPAYDWPAGSFPIYKPVVKWSTGKQMQGEALFFDLSILLPGQIWNRVQQFKSGSALGNALVYSIVALGIIFLFIALTAVVSAVFLTRSITGAVHYLYAGTKRVESGDFDHEIPIRGRDQLGELSISFNQMTRSIRELLTVSAEKQRLDREMQIAAQVQSQLFPRSLPKTAVLDFAPGVCIPARAVSGDYYDFLDVAPGVIGIVVADVCGKGVSAALMMANLHANLRGQVQAYHDAYSLKMSTAAQTDSADSRARAPELQGRAHTVKRIVHRVNQQVADSVMDASFITLFYAEFDEQNYLLHYTNAGHNPPLLLRKRDKGAPVIERLECGGTVLGLFKDVEYDDCELKLESGDLLIAFTDGLVEAHNPQNEEYGEERVINNLIQYADLPAIEIQNKILQAVKDWTANAEQEDDLTLVIFKVN